MWYRKPDRIRAHIWICVFACLLERIVEEEVRSKNVLDSNGKPYTGSRVFDEFRNIMLNEQGFRDPMTQKEQTNRWWVTTQLDQKMLEITNALDVKKESFVLEKGLSY